MQEVAEVTGFAAREPISDRQFAAGARRQSRSPDRRGYAMTDAAPVAGSSYRKLRYALMASLALNVLIIGAVAGTLCFTRSGPGGMAPKGTGLLGFAHTLPRERSDMIRQKFADSQPNMETLRKSHSRRTCGVRDGAYGRAVRSGKVQRGARWRRAGGNQRAPRQGDGIRRDRRAADAGGAQAAARLAREAPPDPLSTGSRAPSQGHARRALRSDALGEEVGLYGAVEDGDGAPSARRRFDLQQRRSLHLQQRAGEADGQRAGPRHGTRLLAADRQDDFDQLAVGNGKERRRGRRGRRARRPPTAC